VENRGRKRIDPQTRKGKKSFQPPPQLPLGEEGPGGTTEPPGRKKEARGEKNDQSPYRSATPLSSLPFSRGVSRGDKG